MRFFPSGARRRTTAACLGLVSLAALTVPLSAQADDDDLKARQREVKGRIADVSEDLKEASKQVTRTTARLQQVTARLESARTHLADVRRRLADARERDDRLKAELAEAEAELERATAALEAGQQAVADQRLLARDVALSYYGGPDPRIDALTSLLDSTSLADVEAARLGEEVVSGSQLTVMDDLAEVEADLAVEQADVERTTAAVEVKREEAAAHLAEVRELYTQSVDAAARVRELVVSTRAARQRAFTARAHDRKVLAQLKQREARISQRLVELARSQRGQIGYNGESDGYLSSPASGPVTSPYGYRTHPIYGYYSLHNGTDFGTGCGAPLYAVAGGTVIDTYYDSVYGNRLFLSLGKVNGKSLVVIYNHMSAYRVSEGDRIARGTVVGLSGTTGWSTGCHLHFTVMENGVAVDPMKYL